MGLEKGVENVYGTSDTPRGHLTSNTIEGFVPKAQVVMALKHNIHIQKKTSTILKNHIMLFNLVSYIIIIPKLSE